MNTSRWNLLFGAAVISLPLSAPQAVAQNAASTSGVQATQSQTAVAPTSVPISNENYLDDRLVWDHPIAAKKDPLGPYTYCIPAGTRLVGYSSSLDTVVHKQPGQPVASSPAASFEKYLPAVLDKNLPTAVDRTSRQVADAPSACPGVQGQDAAPLEADSLVFVNAEDLTDADRHEGLLARIVEWIQNL